MPNPSNPSKNNVRALGIGLAFTALLLAAAEAWGLPGGAGRLLGHTLHPLVRLLGFVFLGLLVGQVIEGAGWTRALAFLAAPLFRFARLGQRCSAAFTTAFFSGVAANAMLHGYLQEGKITRRQLFVTNFINQFPAFFLHLPTTFFIVVPLTRWAGGIYFGLTFAALMLRTALVVLYGRWAEEAPVHQRAPGEPIDDKGEKGGLKNLLKTVKRRLPSRVFGVAAWVVPIYVAVDLLAALGAFDRLRLWMADTAVSALMPAESLSVVVLSFAAEFTSGFAAAGALMDAGVLTVKQTVLALLMGNVLAFPVRALRHQLPRYMGIFSPKLGIQLLLAGQGLRIASLVVVGWIYYVAG